LSSISPKKRFGQNFLKNSETALQIVNFLELKNCKTILEIGPGMGALTKHILNINEFQKIFIEVDKDCCDYLENIFPNIEGKIINIDFLKYNLCGLEHPIAVIGNFPYNISSQILFRIINNLKSISEMVGMFQYEVAERITSAHGSKKYGILSVLIQAYFKVEIKMKLKPDSFFPPPKINSAIIHLKKISNNIECDKQLFIKVVKFSFNQRRKTLRNSLKSFKIDDNIKEDLIFEKRAEELSVKDFIYLTNLISNGIV
jgi:16S rRNA (adenine1518-N6/adenine1519-N6)-dimethyltransferase